MYVVTWLFEGCKQSQKFASSGGAERKAEQLRRFGCSKVNVKFIGTSQVEESTPKPVDKPKRLMNTSEVWAAVDAELKQDESETEMSFDLDDAKELAKELWEAGKTKAEIVQTLNDKFEPTFFQQTPSATAGSPVR